jgi:hypothetical protein
MSTSTLAAARLVSTLALIAQAIAVLVFLFVPFGFDHRSPWGLDFDHFMVLLRVYGIALVVGVVATFWARRPILAIAQLIVFIILFALAYAGVLMNA